MNHLLVLGFCPILLDMNLGMQRSPSSGKPRTSVTYYWNERPNYICETYGLGGYPAYNVSALASLFPVHPHNPPGEEWPIDTPIKW